MFDQPQQQEIQQDSKPLTSPVFQPSYQKPELKPIGSWQVLTGSICEIGDPGC
ncbi:hypothetical protein [Deinococcus roseus]|uniref:Uncharacterized protein n=1 Tax=Deinococcus roseus TaxID=392414 RepID=A0ABQ2DIM1_9DEIO|nr:hypothetical protein [Deinococcus roseus]GGJ58562.1 hypothetical protein GCM10008938_50860 [Deinococcus roseus]